ncbi:MAG: flavodoxin family protein [Candidatus Caldatribacterium sp.]|nr:flavodoxin family protein [Candidatus Caldatribacterium sp.]
MKSLKILGIQGSPRRGGNSDRLLRWFLSEVAEGEEVDILIPSQLRIHFCRGCRYCESTGLCVIRDDMVEVITRLLAADRVVVSTPVFFYGLPASFKALVDRVQPLWARRYVLGEKMPEKMGFLLAVGATKGEQLFEGVVLTIKYFFDAFGCVYKGGLFFRGFDLPGSVEECFACREETKASGRCFFWSEGK